MVPKKDPGIWWPRGDYHVVNSRTVPDRYPLPYLQYFTGNHSGIIHVIILSVIFHRNFHVIFSKVLSVKAYRQIPVASQGIPKTAIVTPFELFE